MNVKVLIEFEFASYDIAGQKISQSVTGSPSRVPKFSARFLKCATQVDFF